MTDYLQHPDWLALLRGVCDDPASDLRRLVAADWLDENGHGGRAEYIRAECRIGELGREFLRANPFDYVGEKLDGYNREFNEVAAALRTLGSHRPGTPQGCVESTSTGGFVSKVWLTQAAFVGGPCGACHGSGRLAIHGRTHGDCRACEGTGRTPGLAAALFGAHPISTIVFADTAVRVEIVPPPADGPAWQSHFYRPGDSETFLRLGSESRGELVPLIVYHVGRERRLG